MSKWILQSVKFVWTNINKEECQKLVNSMIDHLHDVIKTKGDATYINY